MLGKHGMFCRSDLLDRGWTDSLIRRFLGEPDRFKQNPMYRKAAPMKLYAVNRVEKTETTDEWISARDKVRSRVDAALKRANRQRRQNIEDAKRAAASVRIRVKKLPRDVVLQKAIDSYNEWNAENDLFASPDSDAVFLKRIQVNYLRHERTYYDQVLLESQKMSCGLVGASDMRKIAYNTVKDAVLDEIARVYPWLAGECKKQKGKDDA